MYVILAAGRSRRMGFDKPVTPLAGRAPLARIGAALGEREVIVVVPSHLAGAARQLLNQARVIANDEPNLGMAHSLRCALSAIDETRAFAIVLADMPAITRTVIERTEALFLESHADVTYPVNASGVPGHPVLFSPRARVLIDALPAGDTLRAARDDESLRRATWVCEDDGAFRDLDDPQQWETFADA